MSPRHLGILTQSVAHPKPDNAARQSDDLGPVSSHLKADLLSTEGVEAKSWQ
jgi:hypothetical protein